MTVQTLAIIVLLVSFFVMIFLRFPIAYAVGLSSVLCMMVQGQALTDVCRLMVKGISSFSLMAVPFFITMGVLMGSGGISEKLIALADGIAEREGIALQHGCYWGGTGPTYETPAEYRFFHIAGADSVGMSTTPEVIAARHMGLPVFAVSVITNIGLSGLKSTHEEVQQEGRKAQQKMARLFIALLEAL